MQQPDHLIRRGELPAASQPGLRLARQEELYQIQQREIARMEMALKRYKTWVVLNDKFANRVH